MFMNKDPTKARNGFFALFMGAALLGEVFGVLSMSLTTTASGVAFGEPLWLALRSFAGTAAYMAVIFFSGFFPIGQPLTFIVMLIRGMGQGAQLSQLYLSYGTEGLSTVVAVCIPFTVLTAAALSFACIEAAGLSNVYLRHTFTGNAVLGMKDTVKLYVQRFLLLLAVSVTASAIQFIFAKIYR